MFNKFKTNQFVKLLFTWVGALFVFVAVWQLFSFIKTQNGKVVTEDKREEAVVGNSAGVKSQVKKEKEKEEVKKIPFIVKEQEEVVYERCVCE